MKYIDAEALELLIRKEGEKLIKEGTAGGDYINGMYHVINILALLPEYESGHLIPISALKLSDRAYNVLRRGKINAIQDLEKSTKQRLKSIRGLGPLILNEIIEKCKEHGITLMEE
ncbi:MAG: DNA-directed RNA polymerase subunit alpha C-terminal domain-containing protein [Candidatus Ornithomonoglobus sp.]